MKEIICSAKECSFNDRNHCLRTAFVELDNIGLCMHYHNDESRTMIKDALKDIGT